MGDRVLYQQELYPLLQHQTKQQELETYLINHSNLPGPRANLELAFIFSDCVAEMAISQAHINRLNNWTTIDANDADLNDPMVFLPFCALLSLGAIHAKVDANRQQDIIRRLQLAASDSRWRVREGVAMGFQKIAEQNVAVIVNIFSTWIDKANLAEQRAMLAALAHPPILHEANTVRFSLHIASKILSGVHRLTLPERRTEDFRILKKGLAFTISVFIAHLPEAGFPLLLKWAVVDDKDIRWIIKTNLSKSRLQKHYQNQVDEILSLIEHQSEE
jgi:hypothetical protein